MTAEKSKIGTMIVYLYLVVPFLIFSMTWLKWYFALPMTIAILAGCFFLFRHAPELPVFRWKKEHIILIIFLLILWVYLAGVGGYVSQNIDHAYRNGIFRILSESQWPVEKLIETGGAACERGLAYYIGFWLPAAAAGKIFGLEIGYLAQFIWAVIGVMLVYYLICCALKKAAVWPLVLFMTFGGLDLIAYYVTGNPTFGIGNWVHLEQWTTFQFSSFTTQLFWVYNQAIPAWIVLLLLYLQEDNKSMICIWALTMMLSTIPFVGMMPFMAYFMIRNVKNMRIMGKKQNVVALFRSVLSYENILLGFLVGVLSFLFLFGNTSVGETATMRATYDFPLFLMQYILTILFEVGIYFGVIYNYQKKNPLYYITLIWFMICPLIKVGSGEDFCMRASIPAQVVLFLMVAQTLMEAYREKNKKVLIILICLLAISSVTAIHEVNRTISSTMHGNYTRQYIDENIIMTGGNFSGDISNSIFYHFFAQ